MWDSQGYALESVTNCRVRDTTQYNDNERERLRGKERKKGPIRNNLSIYIPNIPIWQYIIDKDKEEHDDETVCVRVSSS